MGCTYGLLVIGFPWLRPESRLPPSQVERFSLPEKFLPLHGCSPKWNLGSLALISPRLHLEHTGAFTGGSLSQYGMYIIFT